MADVTIEEYGLRFVQECFGRYWENLWIPLLFLAVLLWCLFFHRKQVPIVFAGCTVFLCLTVYNPLFVKYLVPTLGFENEYYRFFWILPVIPMLAYYGARLVDSAKKRWYKAAFCLLLTGMLILAGNPAPGAAGGFALPQNLYKVPNDLSAVCSVIHQDQGMENPRVVFEENLNLLARQYDPSIELVLNRDYILYRAGNTVAGKANEKSASYQNQKAIMDVVFYEERIPVEEFQKALQKLRADYLVVYASRGIHDYLGQAGCVQVTVTGEYAVYRCDQEK